MAPLQKYYFLAVGASLSCAVGVLTGMTGTLLLSVCCGGAIGALLIALMIRCVRNRRVGFFEPSTNRFDNYKHNDTAYISEEKCSPRLSS